MTRVASATFLLRLLLAAQLAAQATVGWALVVRAGLPLWAAATIVLLAPALVYGAVIGAQFAIAANAPVAGSAAPAIGLRGWLAAFLRNWWHAMLTFMVLMPLFGERPMPQPARPTRVPVLLIHGFFCNRALWRPMARFLAERGHPVEAVRMDPAIAPLDDYAACIAREVQRLRQHAGSAEVALVCHSMGGLAARAYLRAYGDENIVRVVTIGSPHRGTLHAAYGLGANVRQMRQGSDWLRELAACETPDRCSRFLVILSHQDNIVAPAAVQTLPGADVVALSGIGHLSMIYDRGVWQRVADAIDRTRVGDASVRSGRSSL
ncbi:MAG TPA: alpha/beta fold hydrolase [Burkholderiaceae bacterium]|nr:alpha/beta fold hydrolase [Burkholderiaceae bacterium]